MTRFLIIAIAFGAVVINADSASAQGKKYATPQEVFDAAKTAAAKKDFKAMGDCFTAETVDGMCGGMIFVGSLVKAFAKSDKSDKSAQAAKTVDKIFEKHGLTKEKLEAVPKLDFGKDAKAANQALQILGKLVKDQPAFFGDMTNFLEAQGKKKDSVFDAAAALKDVMVEGNSAKGTVVRDKTEKSISFKKVDGGWRIDLPVEFGSKKSVSISSGN